MKNFLKYTLATITGIIIASILFFVVTLASLSALVASGEKPIPVSDNSILVLKAGIEIPDRGTANPLEGIDLFNMSFTPAPGLNDILHNIEKATTDSKIKGILIENGLLSSGWATMGEIKEALEKFKKEGKFVIAWSDYVLTQQCYYLSSAADKIYIQPGSMVDFKGLSGEVMFYRKALEKIGVEVQVTRHGKFKGAVEPFILDKLSAENKAQIKEYVGSIWQNVISAVSASRNIPVDTLNLLADNLAGNIDARALKGRLVDGLIYRDELLDTLKSLAGISSDKDLSLVSMTKYSKVPDPNRTSSAKDRISVIYASGNIVAGKGNENNIGGNFYADVIRKERLDTSVKAIVLRVNSPGGNAIASDIMWRELELAAKAKPVVVSMGNYAASGGYFISAPATKIYADPSTISGSIGVFGLLPNAGNLLEQKLGLTTEVVSTNKNADSPSITRPMTGYEKEIMQLSIENTYRDFVGKVAEGRKMSPSAVDSIGQGRVWSGTNALKIGLVDTIGGLKAAIGGAAKLAGIDKWSLRELPEIEDPYTRILNELGGELKMKIIKSQLGESVRIYDILNEIKDLSGVQARLPYIVEIH
jgi:protease-4